MSDFLDNLVDRSLGQADVLRPRPQSIFEPPGDAAALLEFSQQYEPAGEPSEPAPPLNPALGESGAGLQAFVAGIAPPLPQIGGSAAMPLAGSTHHVARSDRPRPPAERARRFGRPDLADGSERWPAVRAQVPNPPGMPSQPPTSAWPSQRIGADEPGVALDRGIERLESIMSRVAPAARPAGWRGDQPPARPKPSGLAEASDLTLEPQAAWSAVYRRAQRDPAPELLAQAGQISLAGRAAESPVAVPASQPAVIAVGLSALAAARGAWWVQPSPNPVVVRTPTTRALAQPGISDPASQDRGEPTGLENIRSPRQPVQPGTLRAESRPAPFVQVAETTFEAEPAALSRARAHDGAQSLPAQAWPAALSRARARDGAQNPPAQEWPAQQPARARDDAQNLPAQAWPAEQSARTRDGAQSPSAQAWPAEQPARARDDAQSPSAQAWPAQQPARARPARAAEQLVEDWAPAHVAEAARLIARQRAGPIARAANWDGDQQDGGERPRAFQRPGESPSSPGPQARSRAATRQAAPPADVATGPATVQVTIGRVEVRAAPAERQSRPQAVRAPALSLDEYLRQRGGGRP